jgi:hypothetical protein
MVNKMNVRKELKDLFWRLEYPISGDKIKEDDVTKDDVISFVMDYTSKDMQIVISNVDDYVDELEAERDHYKAQAERYRVTLGHIATIAQTTYRDDAVGKLAYVVDIAKQALESDEE